MEKNLSREGDEDKKSKSLSCLKLAIKKLSAYSAILRSAFN